MSMFYTMVAPFQIILISNRENKVYGNTNTLFRNSMHSNLSRKRRTVKISVTAIYTSANLPPFCIQIKEAVIGVFGGSENSIVFTHHEMRSNTFYESKSILNSSLNLYNCDLWEVCLVDPITKNQILSTEGAFTAIELQLSMDESPQMSQYLYFNINNHSRPNLQFNNYQKVYNNSSASLVTFQHAILANVFPPHNKINIIMREFSTIFSTSTNAIKSSGSFELQAGLYSIGEMVKMLNKHFNDKGASVKNHENILTFNFGGSQIQEIHIHPKMAHLLGIEKYAHIINDLCVIDVEREYMLTDCVYNEMSTIPKLLSVECSLVNLSQCTSFPHRMLRVIYNNQNKDSQQCCYDFEVSQKTTMQAGYVNQIEMNLINLETGEKVFFANPNAQSLLCGGLEIINRPM